MLKHSVHRKIWLLALLIATGWLLAMAGGRYAAAAEPTPLTEGDCDCSPMDMNLEWARVESGPSHSALVWRCQAASNGQTHWVDSWLYQFDDGNDAAENFEQSRAAFSQAVAWASEGKEVSWLVTTVSEPDRFGSLRYYPSEHLYWGEMALMRAPRYYAVFYMSYQGIDEMEARDIFEAAARRILLIMDSKTMSAWNILAIPQEGAVRLGILNFASGTVLLQRPPSTVWIGLESGFPLFSGDKIRTSTESYAEILIGSSRVIGVGPDTMVGLPLTVSGLPTDPPLLNLAHGRIWALIDPLGAEPFSTRIRTADLTVEVKDPASSGFEGISRIECELRAEGGASFASVLDGIVWISDATGAASAAVDAGKLIRAESGGTLSAPQPLELNASDRWWANLPHAPIAEPPSPTTEPPQEMTPTPMETPSPTAAESPPTPILDTDSDDLPIAVVIVPIVVGVMLAGVGLFFYRRGVQEAQAARKKKPD